MMMMKILQLLLAALILLLVFQATCSAKLIPLNVTSSCTVARTVQNSDRLASRYNTCTVDGIVVSCQLYYRQFPLATILHCFIPG